MNILKDRKEAGILLSEKLKKYSDQNPIVLGMPRGGVVVAYEIAKTLHVALDVIVSRKIGLPTQPELAIGAIAPGDVVVLNDEIVKQLGFDQKDIDNLIVEEKKELKRRIELYRGGIELPKVENRVVILVDDGIATGQTALAAIYAVRKLKPKNIILAVGVCALDTKKMLQKEVDEMVCLLVQRYFYAVGQWYENFEQTSDAEVIILMQKAADFAT